ncbi:MAG: L-2-amino-thiazoline-4-carboxylic acid hydrolase [Deltaproteobacteria bacterium]|nr:L-2-amino-thiazoline-4-carboxylic acid hydrolase [Deltaproteobacteria bacterium]
MSDEAITILETRKVEAKILKTLHSVLVRELGREKATRLLLEAIEEAAEEDGRRMAEQAKDGGSLESFKQILPLWARGGALEIKILASDQERLDYDVVRCRYAECYREMGLEDMGYLLSCARDEAFIKGFAPGVRMSRKQVIMNGDERCQFRYWQKKE